MEDLCEKLDDLDMESKYFETVPYDTDDPDFTWYKTVSDFNEDDCVRPHSSSSLCEENERTVSVTRQRKMPKSRKYPQTCTNVSKPEDNKTSKRKSGFDKGIIECRTGPQIPYCNNKFDTSDSDTESHSNQFIKIETESNSKEFIKRRRKYSLSKDTEVNYSTSIYPTSWETVRTGPGSTCPASTETKPNYPYAIPTHISPPRKREQLNHQRSNRTFNLNRTFPLSSTECGSWSTSEGEPSSFISKSPYKKFKRSLKFTRHIMKPTDIMPCYKNYQLLGDSQLLRFSEQLLNCRPYVTFTEDTSSRRLGYCVSGQKIKELEQRILKNELKLSDKLIILIGTNDMVYGTELKSMCDSFDSILKKLRRTAERIVILTVPPVPKIAYDGEHILKLKRFNDFLLHCDDRRMVFTVDLATLFISYSNTISDRFFEPVFHKSHTNKVDLIHLNQSGFKLLRAILEIEYFDKYI